MLRIKDWDCYFENNRSRQISKVTWVPIPNKHDGSGYTTLLAHQDGTAHFGCWCLLVEVASKCQPRGTLVRSNGVAHTAETLAAMTHANAAQMAAAIERLVASEINWLEKVAEPGGRQSGVRRASGGRQEGAKERKKEGEKERSKEREEERIERTTAAPFSLSVDDAAVHGSPTHDVIALYFKVYEDAYHRKPVLQGADTRAAKILGGMVGKQFALRELEDALKAYTNDAEPFVQAQGCTLRFFLSRINVYLNCLASQDAGEPTEPITEYQDGFDITTTGGAGAAARRDGREVRTEQHVDGTGGQSGSGAPPPA